jgi:phenylalanyl-tRNA synthetase beta chain
MAGLEVDGVEPVAPPLDGVVVGRIAEISQHPDADRLRVCQVDVGGDDLVQVVCGAPNARQGLCAPIATVGTVLPGEFKIKRSKLRGIESLGMLCSAVELGLGEAADGLLELADDATPGTPLTIHLGLDDTAIEVDLTPNRGDCLGLAGIAREVGVLNRATVTPVATDSVAATVDDTFPVELAAPEGCPRYLGRVIRGIDPHAVTPTWMQERLRRSGIRSLGPLVDVTNYVMLELGQPMHAFDLSRLTGGIVVRWAAQGEKLLLLDGREVGEVGLDTETLVIADHGQAVAIAGVMGGELSGIADDTDTLFLESAFFAPTVIAGRARRYGMHTDASHRFERGVDPELQRRAIERATALLLEIVGGEPGTRDRGRRAWPGRRGGRRGAPASACHGAAAACAHRTTARDRHPRRRRRGDPGPTRHAVERHRRWVAGAGAELPLRHRHRGRPDRGTRAHLRLRQGAGEPSARRDDHPARARAAR